MSKNLKKVFLSTALIVMAVVCLAFSASAEEKWKDYYYEENEDGTVSISDYNGKGAVNIPSTINGKKVTSINYYAFSGCKDITSITIPDSVTFIGHEAFYNCEKLASITIPDNVTYIGDLAFYNTAYYNKASNWKNGVLYIGNHLIRAKDSVTSYSINKGTKTLAGNAFGWCSELKSVTIPDSVVSIGYSAFEECTSLTSITIGKGVKSIGEDAFYWCTKLKSITIPDSITSIGYAAFYGCESLKSVVIGKGVKSIGEKTFYNCQNLKSVYIPKNVTEIGTAAFGYYEDDETCAEKINKSFEIVGVKGSAAQEYAKDNGFKFVEYDSHAHTYTNSTTKATLTKNGKVTKKCSVCGYTKTTTVYYPKTVTLSKTNYIYDGKNKTPTVTVKDADGNVLTKNIDYKISVASKRSGIGRYTVKVTFMGDYSGTKNLYFYIKPGKTDSVKSAAQTVSSIKLSWSKVPGAAGYTVYRYSPAKKAYVKAGTTSGTSLTVKSLLAGTKYTFKVVAYGKTSAGKVYDSDSYTLLKTATKTKTPSLTKVTSPSKGTATLTWSAVDGETGYQVYYSTKKDSGFKKYANFAANSKSGKVTGLTNGKTYYFKVRTYIKTDSGYVYSAWSTVKSVTIAASYYVTKTGAKYHVDGCSSLSKSKIEISYKDAVAKGYKACDKCIG